MGLVVHLVLVVVAALVVNGVRDRRIRQNTTPPTAPTTIPPVIQECVWDRIHMPVNRPLILDSQKNIVLPVREWRRKIIRVPAGTNLTFACSGSTFSELPKVAGVPVSTAAVHAVCVDGRELNMDGKIVYIWDMECTNKIKPTLRSHPGRKCGYNSLNTFYTIEFETFKDSFYSLIEVCFEPSNKTTLWTSHILHGHNIAAKYIRPKGIKRPDFKTFSGIFKDISMDTIYLQDTQQKLFIKLLGNDNLYDVHKQWWFAKGHMSPDADFVTEAEQDATYYYINALPQWQAVNNGNWKHLEDRVRIMAGKRRTDLKIISGGFQVLELQAKNSSWVSFMLGKSVNMNVVPVPALTWKVVFDETLKRAAALVSINNPHTKSTPARLCKDICDDLAWMEGFDFDDLSHGYTYCCEVADLKRAIPDIPDIGNVEILAS